MPGEGRSLVVVDADDTLWSTQPLYDSARAECRHLVEGVGISGDAWDSTQRAIDSRNLITMGLSKERFPKSCVEAYRQLAGSNAQSALADEISRAAEQVFLDGAYVSQGTAEALSTLGEDNRLVLLTQGDAEVQLDRLAKSRLGGLFADVVVVDRKSREAFEYILRHDGRPAALCWSVGNNLDVDILPARGLGMQTIWFKGLLDTQPWSPTSVERTIAPRGVLSANSMSEVQETIESHSISQMNAIRIKELASSVRPAWSAETSASEDWTPERPSLGQCAVTSLIVQDALGGELLRTTVGGVSHYWNRLADDTEVDLTSDQFDVFEFGSEPQVRDRDYVLSFPVTKARYNRLQQTLATPEGAELSYF